MSASVYTWPKVRAGGRLAGRGRRPTGIRLVLKLIPCLLTADLVCEVAAGRTRTAAAGRREADCPAHAYSFVRPSLPAF